MEKYLSKLLKQIQICDNLYSSSFEDSEDASQYNKMLNIVLTNLTNHFNLESDKDSLDDSNLFANLQLNIKK